MKTIAPWRTRDLASLTDFDALERRMRRAFGRVLPDADVETAMDWLPAMDLTENDGAFELTAEIPGLKPEDVEVTVEGDVLTIRGEKQREEKKQEEGKWHLWERSYGSFERSLTLPRSVDDTKVTANFTDGVLKVTLPKRSESKGRKIEVSA